MNIDLRAIVLFILLLNLNIVRGDNLDSILATLDSDSARLEWLILEINQAWHSDPELTSELAFQYNDLAQESGDNITLAKAANLNGMAAYTNDNYDIAVDFYLEALHRIEGQDEVKLEGIIHNNLASCYVFRNENSKSIEYYLLSLEAFIEIKDTSRLAMIHNNLGIQYVEAGKYRSASNHYTAAEQLYRKLNQPLYIGITLLSRGNLQIEQGQYEGAIRDYENAMSLVPETSIPLVHAASIAGIGSAYNRMGEYRKGEEFLLQSLTKANKMQHIEQIKESNRELSDLYESTGQYNKSLVHYKTYTAAKDSLFSNEQDQIIMNALTKYEAEKKQKENLILRTENELNQLKLIASKRRGLLYAMGFIGFAIFSILLFRLNGRIKNQNTIISNALSEKEILLKEIHHRVKNNLQFISSLLNLQSEHVEDKVALGALQEGQDRVHSMALIHQNLYQEDNLTGVDMKQYFVKLVRGLFDSYNIRRDQIQLELEIEDLNLDVDTVIPIGLIVNELVSNSLKYAFPDKMEGVIRVSLNENQNILHVNVADNGIGMSPKQIDTVGASFGYRLINVFKDQMNADLQIESKGGTSVSLYIRKYKMV